MASQRLTPTAKVILGMLRLGARTGYEIKSITDVSTRFFWGASYGQIYPELKRLEAAGLAQSEHDPRGEVKRTAYTLTPAGEELLQEWLTADDAAEFAFRDEGLLRFFFGDVVDPEQALENVRRQRLAYEERLAHFRTIQPGEEMRYPRLALEYGIAFLEWNVQWWGDLERRLSRALARTTRRRETRAPARR